MNASTSNNDLSTHSADLTESEISELYGDSILQILDNPYEFQLDKSNLRQEESHEGFDNNTGDTWIYPINYPIRQYQYNISRAALFHNTLVALPTGLGKTFIAAVVMFNIYRWYPACKIIFMAPTRPLVSQQIEACHNITGIPRKDCIEITGKQSKAVRSVLWQTKRIFFATPQTVQSDLSSDENFPFKQIRLIVIDEAHKAKGKYAYTEVVQSILSRNRFFRVLALSATPGRHIKDVVEVVRNLLISHVEIRWENSIDVASYVHKRRIETAVVPLGPRLKEIREEFAMIADKYIRRLYECDVLTGSSSTLTKSVLFMQQKQYRETACNRQNPKDSQISADFSMAVNLLHALELLEKHGLRIFLNFFDDETNVSKLKYFVAKDRSIKPFLDKIREEVGPDPFKMNDETLPNGSICEMPQNFDFGHPKYKILTKYLVDHFTAKENSRVIVFCEYRESVLLLHRLLLQNRPLIKPKIIVGKGSSIGIKAVTEKQQKFVMQQFRDGIVNTLVATCVVEEGIDVGEIDLIVCFDIATKNPTRFVQRIGRTGRRAEGRIVALVTEGLEHGMLKEVLATRDQTNKKIVRDKEIKKNLYANCPRLVPTEFNPKCIEVVLKIDDDSNVLDQTTTTPRRQNAERKTRTKLATATESKNKEKPNVKGIREYFQKIDPSQANAFATSSKVTEPNIENAIIHLDSDCEDTPPTTTSAQEQAPSSSTSALWNKLKSHQKELNAGKTTNPSNNKTPSKIDDIFGLERHHTSNKFMKRLLLKMSPDLVKFKMDAAAILNNLNRGNNKDAKLPPHFEKLRNEVTRIEQIFGGKEVVMKYLSNFKELKRYLEAANALSGRLWEMDEERLQVQDDNCDNVYEVGLEEYELRVLGLKFAFNTLKRDLHTELELKHDQTFKASDYNTQMETTESFENSQSANINYESKYTHHTAAAPIASTSGIKLGTSFNSPWANSPLLAAFNKSINKRINSDNMARLSSTPQPNKSQTTLEYFLLDTIDELFCDSGAVTTSVIVPRKLFEPQHHAPSQESRASKRELDLGGLDEIFASDEEMFADYDDDTQVQIHTKPPSELNAAPKMRCEKSSDLFDVSSSVGGRSSEPKFENKCEQIEEEEVTIVPPSSPPQRTTLTPATEITSPSVLFGNRSLHRSFRAPKDSPQTRPKNISFSLPTATTPLLSQIPVVANRKCKRIFDSTDSENSDTDENKPPASSSPRPCLAAVEITSPSIFRNRSYLSSQRSFPASKDSPQPRAKNISFSLPTLASPLFSQIPAVANRRRKRTFESSDSETSVSPANEQQRHKRSRQQRQRRRCALIDDEAAVSGTDSDDHETQTQEGIQNSIIDDDFDEHNYTEHHRMHEIYLKSVKSPLNNRPGAFKIPDPRKFVNITDIFSQMPEQDATYHEIGDSFVVAEDALISDNEPEELCPLEQAEAILKARRAKRKKLKKPGGTNRRKVILLDDSSDE